jgi:tetratricopeptide (TPR) repeat protein
MKARWHRLHKWRIATVFLLVLFALSTAGAQQGDIAEALRLTGQVEQYYATGRYQEAIPLAQRALAIREKALGPEHLHTATALSNLAALFDEIGAYAKAEPLLERAQSIDEINTTRLLLSGDETRKRAYLQKRRGDAGAKASFSLAVTDPRVKARGSRRCCSTRGGCSMRWPTASRCCAAALIPETAAEAKALQGLLKLDAQEVLTGADATVPPEALEPNCRRVAGDFD